MNILRVATQRVARPAQKRIGRRTYISERNEPANDLAGREISIGLGLGIASALAWVVYARSEAQVFTDYYNALEQKNKKK